VDVGHGLLRDVQKHNSHLGDIAGAGGRWNLILFISFPIPQKWVGWLWRWMDILTCYQRDWVAVIDLLCNWWFISSWWFTPCFNQNGSYHVEHDAFASIVWGYWVALHITYITIGSLSVRVSGGKYDRKLQRYLVNLGSQGQNSSGGNKILGSV
jgi:hypothetical protein